MPPLFPPSSYHWSGDCAYMNNCGYFEGNDGHCAAEYGCGYGYPGDTFGGMMLGDCNGYDLDAPNVYNCRLGRRRL